MLNSKKHDKIALAIMAVLSVGTVLCLLGFKPEKSNKNVIESSNQ